MVIKNADDVIRVFCNIKAKPSSRRLFAVLFIILVEFFLETVKIRVFLRGNLFIGEGPPVCNEHIA